ncbi:MAG: RHS repeat-associated core domain-containing protein, partial [Bacteroidota bacterium]|nr:RHS repeat-associated core domain-containing protein [Bacteroidota bacterium]
NYDAQIGRWLQPDPLMQHPSPYLAMSNNPVSFTDPLGLWDGNPILDRNGYPISGLFSTDGAYYQVDWSLTVSNGHNVGSTAFYVSEMDEYNYKIKSLNKYFSPLYDKYYHTMYANGNLRRNGEAYGEVAARYFDNQLAWGMSLKEGAQSGGGSWLSAASGGLAVGELARQGKMYEQFGKGGYYVEKALEQGKYIHKGEVYWQGKYKGVTNAMKESIEGAKFAKNLGRGMTGVGIAISGYQLLSSKGTGVDYARFTGSLIITSTAAIPIAGPFISIGLGLADSFGTFDPIYNYFGK